MLKIKTSNIYQSIAIYSIIGRLKSIRKMTEKNFEWLRTEKIKEAQKMMEDGLPIEVICKMLGLSP